MLLIDIHQPVLTHHNMSEQKQYRVKPLHFVYYVVFFGGGVALGLVLYNTVLVPY